MKNQILEMLDDATLTVVKNGEIFTIENAEVQKMCEYIKNYLPENPSEDISDKIKQIVCYLNEKTGKHFRPTNKATVRCVKARLNEGYVVEDFKKVIDTKVSEWSDTEYDKYLNPETMFGNKFDKYLNQNLGKPKTKRSSEWG